LVKHSQQDLVFLKLNFVKAYDSFFLGHSILNHEEGMGSGKLCEHGELVLFQNVESSIRLIGGINVVLSN